MKIDVRSYSGKGTSTSRGRRAEALRTNRWTDATQGSRNPHAGTCKLEQLSAMAGSVAKSYPALRNTLKSCLSPIGIATGSSTLDCNHHTDTDTFNTIQKQAGERYSPSLTNPLRVTQSASNTEAFWADNRAFLVAASSFSFALSSASRTFFRSLLWP